MWWTNPGWRGSNIAALAGAGGGGGGGPMSVVLSNAANSYLQRTWGAAPTNNKIATFSFWIKLTSVPSVNGYFYEGNGFSYFHISGGSGGQFIYENDHASNIIRTNQLVNDTTTWHHLLYQFDSTQATASNRTNIYLDGVICTYAAASYVPQNQDMEFSTSGNTSHIGDFEFVHSQSYDGKFAYWHYIDGQALTPSSFTTGTGSGTIHPIAYGGTYGTNGFKLDFSGSNANDQSGNGNNWSGVNGPTFSSDVPT